MRAKVQVDEIVAIVKEHIDSFNNTIKTVSIDSQSTYDSKISRYESSKQENPNLQQMMYEALCNDTLKIALESAICARPQAISTVPHMTVEEFTMMCRSHGKSVIQQEFVEKLYMTELEPKKVNHPHGWFRQFEKRKR